MEQGLQKLKEELKDYPDIELSLEGKDLFVSIKGITYNKPTDREWFSGRWDLDIEFVLIRILIDYNLFLKQKKKKVK